MPRTTTDGKTWTGYGVFAVAGLVCLAAIVFLTLSVTKDLRLLNSARSDNVQWTLSQTEVEFLEFEAKIAAAFSDPTIDLNLLRREFDIFFSRIATLGSGSIYGNLRQTEDFRTSLSEVQTFLDDAVTSIDGDDPALRMALPDMLENARATRPKVRRLSNSGLSYFANDADQRRQDISVTLIRLATIVAVLIFMLLAFALYVGRLNALNIRRGRETFQTSVRMNTVMSTSLDGVIVTDANGHILEFNHAAEAMFGQSASDVRGLRIGDVIVPDHFKEAHEAGMERMRQNGVKRVVGKGRVQLEAKRHNSEVFPVELAIQSAETDDGDIFIAFLRDISKRVADNQELVEARDKALAGEKAKSDFLAVMSHEIRTPLNGLLGNLELLQDTKVTKQQSNLIGNMKTSGRLLMSHVTDVLDISRYDAGKLELQPNPLNLNDFLQELIDNQSGFAREQNTSLDWSWNGPSVDWVSADRDVMQAILLNLLGNAVKFTKDGAVEVEAEVLKSSDDIATVEFRIADTGVGIEESAQTTVFNDFATGNVSYNRLAGGTGLGLGIAKRFATALGGEIGGESAFGEGSLFWVRLPLQMISGEAALPGEAQDHTPTKSQRVLVVEDNEINRQVVREMLKAQGHDVVEAVDGLSGVERAKSEKFDLILMDISMPVMDGRAATRAIRSGNGASAHVPIVALTANAMEDERAAFLEDGMNDVLSKPLTRRALAGLMQSVPDAAPATLSDGWEFVDVEQLLETHEALQNELFMTSLGKMDQDVGMFLDWLPTTSPEESDSIAQQAHKHAGVVAMFGALQMYTALKGLETDAKSGHVSDLAKLSLALRTMWTDTMVEIKARVKD